MVKWLCLISAVEQEKLPRNTKEKCTLGTSGVLSDDSASTPRVIQRLAARCGRGFGLPCPAALARNVKGTFLHMCYTTDIFNKTHTDMRRCIFMVCK